MLRELIDVYGINPSNITIGDPNGHIFKHNYDVWHEEFTNIKYLDSYSSQCGRTPNSFSATPLLYFSDNGSALDPGVTNDYLPQAIESADYVINLANLKPHMRAGVSFCAKNFFGTPSQGCNRLHPSLVAPNEGDQDSSLITNSGYEKYRVFVDIMGNKYLGKNTMLFIIDAYYGGPYHDQKHPVKYQMEPFNNNWCASLLMSQDEVALESVALDILKTEFNGVNQGTHISPNWLGVDDYLHQAADSANWPDSIDYTPNGDGIPISSLGVHEHWNNAIDRKYTKNLSPGGDPNVGIELVYIDQEQPSNTNNNELEQNFSVFPNPANREVTISYKVPARSQVKIDIYSLNGSKLVTLFDADQSEGKYSVKWEIQNSTVASGIYLCRVTIGGYTLSEKIRVIQ
jgi:hypothetical protein